MHLWLIFLFCEAGLGHAEAEKRLAEYGPNELAKPKGDSFVMLFARHEMKHFTRFCMLKEPFEGLADV